MKALVEQVYQLLKGDAEMQALFPPLSDELATRYPSGVALYYKMALKDPPMPYVVHLDKMRNPPGDPAPVQAGPYLLDVWDYGPDADRALAIVKRIKALLSGVSFPIGGTLATLHYVGDESVKTDDDDVHHHALEFAAWAWDHDASAAILDRA